MLSESSFVINHWITILWIVAAGLYTSFAVVADMLRPKRRSEDTKEF